MEVNPVSNILEREHNIARGDEVKTYAQETLAVFERLNEAAQISVLRFAEFLAAGGNDEWLPYNEAEMEEDIRLYDEVKANDDGYRISASDLRKKYGIQFQAWEVGEKVFRWTD